MGDEYISVGEFARFANSLDERLAGFSRSMHEGFNQLNGRLDAMNGRGRTTEAAVVRLDEQMKGLCKTQAAMDDRAVAIDGLASDAYARVAHIDKEGCGAVKCLEDTAFVGGGRPRLPLPSGWKGWHPTIKSATMGGSAVGGGLVVYEAVRLGRELLAWLSTTSIGK